MDRDRRHDCPATSRRELRRRRERWIHRATIAIAAAAVLLCTGALLGQKADTTDEQLVTTREALKGWVANCKAISKEKRDLAEAEELLKSRIEVVRGRIDALKAKTAEAETGITGTDTERAKLANEYETLRSASAALDEIIVDLEARTTALLAKLPAFVRDDPMVKTLSVLFPADPAQTDKSLSVRFQNVVGVLNQLNKFAREIRVASELLTLADGRKMEVRTVYLGIAQAYYVSDKGDVAGLGRPGETGWTWVPANQAAPQIAAVIAILANEKPADYVQLPIEIK